VTSELAYISDINRKGSLVKFGFEFDLTYYFNSASTSLVTPTTEVLLLLLIYLVSNSMSLFCLSHNFVILVIFPVLVSQLSQNLGQT